jgi:hypothetical protein
MVDSLNRIIGPNDLFGVMTQNTDPRALTFGRRLISVEEQLSKYWTWGERYRLATDPTDTLEEDLKSCFQYKPPTLTNPLPPWYVDDNGQRFSVRGVMTSARRKNADMAQKVLMIAGNGAGCRLVTKAGGSAAIVESPGGCTVGLPQVRGTAGGGCWGRANDRRDNSSRNLQRRTRPPVGLDDTTRFPRRSRRERANGFLSGESAGHSGSATPLSEGRAGQSVGLEPAGWFVAIRCTLRSTDGIAVIDRTISPLACAGS